MAKSHAERVSALIDSIDRLEQASQVQPGSSELGDLSEHSLHSQIVIGGGIDGGLSGSDGLSDLEIDIAPTDLSSTAPVPTDLSSADLGPTDLSSADLGPASGSEGNPEDKSNCLNDLSTGIADRYFGEIETIMEVLSNLDFAEILSNLKIEPAPSTYDVDDFCDRFNKRIIPLLRSDGELLFDYFFRRTNEQQLYYRLFYLFSDRYYRSDVSGLKGPEASLIEKFACGHKQQYRTVDAFNWIWWFWRIFFRINCNKSVEFPASRFSLQAVWVFNQQTFASCYGNRSAEDGNGHRSSKNERNDQSIDQSSKNGQSIENDQSSENEPKSSDQSIKNDQSSDQSIKNGQPIDANDSNFKRKAETGNPSSVRAGLQKGSSAGTSGKADSSKIEDKSEKSCSKGPDPTAPIVDGKSSAISAGESGPRPDLPDKTDSVLERKCVDKPEHGHISSNGNQASDPSNHDQLEFFNSIAEIFALISENDSAFHYMWLSVEGEFPLEKSEMAEAESFAIELLRKLISICLADKLEHGMNWFPKPKTADQKAFVIGQLTEHKLRSVLGELV